ncbi:MAG: zinc metallopeptidase [Spirochaetota bacterium]|nr:zinc metallopeptidase [Spirochaetota bacterium]
MLFGIDPLYWMMMLPVLVLSVFASIRVKTTFKKYSRIPTHTGLRGVDIAEKILKTNGLSHIPVVETGGFLSDHYDPIRKVVRLSSDVYQINSLAAIGVAAHETGHAIQHAKSYAPLMLRNAMAPTASIGSNLAWIIILVGFIIGTLGLVKLGILLFTITVIFQLITLPVEFNATSRAKAILLSQGFIGSNEMVGVEKVLSAAAMTYVAAAASSIVTLLYFIIRTGLLGAED